MQVITSNRNPAVLAARALQTREGRESAGQFLCEGEHLVGEAIRHDAGRIRALFVEQGRETDFATLVLGATDAALYSVPAHVLQTISQVKTPQGIAATVDYPPAASLEMLGERVVLLENVQDPGNVGTVLRTADAAGFTGCVLTGGCADPFSAKTLRATMGSVFRVPIAFTQDACRAADTLAAMGFAMIATVLNGQDFYARDPLPPKVCLLVGNEGAGLTAALCEKATHRYRLPMRGGAESLNAAVAAAVFMYEIVNRG